MCNTTGLGSPLLSASDHPHTGGCWTPGVFMALALQVWTSALPLGHAAICMVLCSTPADGASFISVTPEKEFQPSKLSFRNRHVPLPSLLCPSGPASTQTYFSLIHHSCCRALSSAHLQSSGSQGRQHEALWAWFAPSFTPVPRQNNFSWSQQHAPRLHQ